MVMTWASRPFWVAPASWEDAGELLAFRPRVPSYTAGATLQALRVRVRRRLLKLAVGDRNVEAQYGAFVLSQARPGREEARRLALETPYGRDPHPTSITGHDGKLYEGRPVDGYHHTGALPSLVTWSDGDMHFLIASGDLPATELLAIAVSLY